MSKIDVDHLLNQYVADTAVMFIKLHNIHWNIVGSDFLELHKYTEELYNHFFKTYDEFAEILKIKNKTVYGSMADYLKVATIKELGLESLNTKQALNIIKDDFSMLLITLMTMRGIAHTEGDISTTIVAEEEIKFLNQQIWFISTLLK